MPSLPCGSAGGRSGYAFDDTSCFRASYFVAMEQVGLITQEGCDLPMDRWKDSSFFLPFKISPEVANYSADMSEKVLQRPIPNNSGKFALFLEFEEPTAYVLR